MTGRRPLAGYRAVIFDLDDTLLDTFAVKWRHHAVVARAFYGIELTKADVRRHWGMPFDAMVTALYRHADTTERMVAANRRLEHLFPKRVQEGAVELVRSLLGRGVAVAVVTSTNTDMACRDLQRLEFPLDALRFVHGADVTEFHKPDPRVFRLAIEALGADGVEPAEAIYVGDSLADRAAAVGAGLHFLGVTTGLVSGPQFEHAGAPFVLRLLDAAELY